MFWRTLLHLHFQVQGRCVSLHRTLLPPASDDFRPWLNESVFSFTVFCNIFRNAFLSIFIFPFSLPLSPQSVTWIRPDTRIPAGPTHSGKLQGKESRLLNNNNNNNNNTHIGPIMQKPLMQFEVWIFAKCRRPDCSKLRERNVEQHEMFFNFSPRFQSWKPTRPTPGVGTRSRHAVSGRPSGHESRLLWSKESDVLRWADNVSVCVSAEGHSSLSSLFRIQPKTPRQGTRRWNWNQRTTPRNLRGARKWTGGLKTRVRGLKTRVRGLKTHVRGLKTRVRGLETRVRGLKTHVRGLKTHVRGLKTRVRGLKTRVRGLETRVRGLKTRVRGLETRVRGLETHVRGLKTRVRGLKTRVRGLKTHMRGLKTRVRGLETHVRGLKTCEGTGDTCEGTGDTCEGTGDTCEGTEDTCEGTGDTCEGTEDQQQVKQRTKGLERKGCESSVDLCQAQLLTVKIKTRQTEE